MASIQLSLVFIVIMSTQVYNHNILVRPSRIHIESVPVTGQDTSDDCKRIKACVSMPDYPYEEVNKLIPTLGDKVNSFPRAKLVDDSNGIQHRVGSLSSAIELCNFTSQILEFEGLQDKHGVIHTVLKGKDSKGVPIQSFRTEICVNNSNSEPYTKYVSAFQHGYIGRCIQKFTYWNVATVVKNPNGSLRVAASQAELKVPSFCAFVASHV